MVGGFRKRHDAACALKGKRAYLRQAASSSSAPQQPAAAARKRASGVAPGVGQIVFSGNWHYSPDLKRNRVICRSDFLFEKKGKGCGFNVRLSCRASSGFTRLEGYG